MKSKLVTAFAALSALAFAGWGGYVFCTQVTLGGMDGLYILIPLYVALLLVGAFFNGLIHEFAHCLVGAMCLMGVKPPRIRLFKSSSIEVSPKGARAMRLRFTLTAAAGLFFDLLLIALGAVAFAVPQLSPFFGVLSPYALYSFIINVAPLEYKSGKTDGLAISEVLKNDPSAQVMLQILRVQGLVNGGMPLKDVPEEMLINVPQLPEDDTNFIILTQLRYEYYKAAGNEAAAKKYLQRYNDLVDYLPEEYREQGQHLKI